jgi:hypothetical protein
MHNFVSAAGPAVAVALIQVPALPDLTLGNCGRLT